MYIYIYTRPEAVYGLEWLKQQGDWLRTGQQKFDPRQRRFSLFIHLQTDPDMLTGSYKTSTRAFLGLKMAKHRASHPISS